MGITVACIMKMMNCQLTSEKGNKCRARVLKNGKYCFFHSPDKVTERKLAVRNGGLTSRKNNTKLPERKIEGGREVIGVVAETINLLRAGKIHPNYSNSIFLGCNTLLKALEQVEVQGKIEKLESKIEQAELWANQR